MRLHSFSSRSIQWPKEGIIYLGTSPNLAFCLLDSLIMLAMLWANHSISAISSNSPATSWSIRVKGMIAAVYKQWSWKPSLEPQKTAQTWCCYHQSSIPSISPELGKNHIFDTKIKCFQIRANTCQYSNEI